MGDARALITINHHIPNSIGLIAQCSRLPVETRATCQNFRGKQRRPTLIRIPILIGFFCQILQSWITPLLVFLAPSVDDMPRATVIKAIKSPTSDFLWEPLAYKKKITGIT